MSSEHASYCQHCGDVRLDLGEIEQLLHLALIVVGHANAPRAATALELFKLSPDLLDATSLLREAREVNQVQVEVINTEVRQGLVELGVHVLALNRVVLGRDEELIARDVGCLESSTNRHLVAVDPGIVDVAPAVVQRREDPLGRVLLVQGPVEAA